MLESYIKEKLNQKPILLMTHIVLGYPSLTACEEIVRQMVEAGVDLIELQIPFSEPMADGPVILNANQQSIESGITVDQCFEFAGQMASQFDIPFLFMTYANILYRYGMERFSDHMHEKNIKGTIVPDLPPEEGMSYLSVMEKNGHHPIMLYSPETSKERMQYLNRFSKGFVYCVARKGVTGGDTRFSSDLDTYLQTCRETADLPIAVGFGVKEKQDMEYLTGKADIAVIGSQVIRIIEEKGVTAVKDFISQLTQVTSTF